MAGIFRQLLPNAVTSALRCTKWQVLSAGTLLVERCSQKAAAAEGQPQDLLLSTQKHLCMAQNSKAEVWLSYARHVARAVTLCIPCFCESLPHAKAVKKLMDCSGMPTMLSGTSVACCSIWSAFFSQLSMSASLFCRPSPPEHQHKHSLTQCSQADF